MKVQLVLIKVLNLYVASEGCPAVKQPDGWQTAFHNLTEDTLIQIDGWILDKCGDTVVERFLDFVSVAKSISISNPDTPEDISFIKDFTSAKERGDFIIVYDFEVEEKPHDS